MTDSDAVQSPKSYKCPDCGRTYRAIGTLNRHRQNHSRHVSYVCSICKVGFRRNDLLHRHMQTHTRIAPIASRTTGHHEDQHENTANSRDGSSGSYHSRGSGELREATLQDTREGLLSDPGATGASPNYDLMATDGAWPQLDAGYASPSANTTLELDNGLFNNANWLWTNAEPSMGRTLAWEDTDSAAKQPYDMSSSRNDECRGQEGLPPVSVIEPSSTEYRSSITNGTAAVNTLDVNQDLTIPNTDQDATETMVDLEGRNSQVESEQLIDDIVNYACFNKADNSNEIWTTFSARIKQDYNLEKLSSPHAAMNVVEEFAKQFFQQFHCLHPLFYQHDIGYSRFPSHLFAMMIAIGSAYAGNEGMVLHTRLLEALKLRLSMAIFQQKVPDTSLLSVCQSLFLIQMATLIFGNETALSSAEQLGSVLVSLARRLKIFINSTEKRREILTWASESRQSLLQKWIESEERRRLAFGIFKVQVWIAMLQGKKPLVSWEEMDIYTPSPNTLWIVHNEELSDDIIHLAKSPAAGPEYIFSDLVRLVLDKEEQLPTMLPQDLELLILGLQQQVWYFGYDPESKTRLSKSIGAYVMATETSEQNVYLPQDVSQSQTSIVSLSALDLLDHSSRKMKDTRHDWQRLFSALDNWKACLGASITVTVFPHERSTLLNGHLLYAFSMMSVKAPLLAFHRLAIQVINGRHSDLLNTAHAWATTANAKTVIRHACTGWSLVSKEIRRPIKDRATFDMTAHIVLLHSAIIIWVYAGAHSTPGEACLTDMDQDVDLRLCRTNNKELMSLFSNLLKRIVPESTRAPEFHKTVTALVHCRLPVLE